MSAETVVNRELFDEVMVPNYAPGKLIPVKGSGSIIWDQEGHEYIDFAGGIAVNALGHAHPDLTRVIRDQSEKLWHVSNVLSNEPALRLAKKLCDATFADKIFFANSGGEANEAALKLARKYASDNFLEEKNEIISFKQSFHGRTLFTVSVGGQEKYTKGFGPLPQGITHLAYNDLEEVKARISDKTCAVMVEPIQGEGGIINGKKEFLQGLRELCDKHQALLIFDEVQTGFGRTGTLYDYMRCGVTPDILTSAKGLGCGFPIGAMMTTGRIAESFGPGTHGCTYGGNPLATAVSEKALEIIGSPEVLEGVNKKRALFAEIIGSINKAFPFMDEMRGEGLLIGLALNEAWKEKGSQLVAAAEGEGLMILVAGPSVIRMAPSLIIPDDLIEKGLEKFRRALEKVSHKES